MESLENDCIIYWIENGILHSQFKKNTILTTQNIEEVIQLRHNISNNQMQYWCADMANLIEYKKGARDYAEIHGQEFLHATAAIVNSHIARFILNTYMQLKKAHVPLKAFRHKKDAIIWLNEMKENIELINNKK